ncbi:MAG TPA: ATP-binding protein [Methanoregula sp.]|nr:ATP-binding protein [Methanoregula sp.]
MPGTLEALIRLNPWWYGESVPGGIPRDTYLSRIRHYATTGEIIVIAGVRRAGKTTLLYQTIDHFIRHERIPAKNILFVNFDEPDFSFLDDPFAEILSVYRAEVCGDDEVYLIFDEIQGVPGWERHIKALYDRGSVKLIISGSSSSLIEGNLAALLAGRYFAVTVYPLDFAEYLRFHRFTVPNDPLALAAQKFKVMNHLAEYLRNGGFPRVVLQKDQVLRTEYLRSYYDSIVYRDIILSNRVRHVRALKDILVYLFSNITRPYSYQQLQKQSGLDFATLKEYISYAGAAGVLYEVPFFSYSLKTQSRNNRKIFAIDNGLRNAVSFTFSPDAGLLAENLVFIQLLRQGAEPYYWSGKHEVDFVIKNPDGTLDAINVSYTDTPDEREYAGLREFLSKHAGKVQKRILITRDLEQEAGGIHCIPLWKWLLMNEP